MAVTRLDDTSGRYLLVSTQVSPGPVFIRLTGSWGASVARLSQRSGHSDCDCSAIVAPSGSMLACSSQAPLSMKTDKANRPISVRRTNQPADRNSAAGRAGGAKSLSVRLTRHLFGGLGHDLGGQQGGLMTETRPTADMATGARPDSGDRIIAALTNGDFQTRFGFGLPHRDGRPKRRQTGRSL